MLFPKIKSSGSALVFCLFLISCCLAWSETNQPVRPSVDDGFRGIKPGMELKSFQDLEKQFEYKGTTTYIKKKDALSFGPYALEEISYEFYRGRLVHINLWASGTTSIAGVQGELKRLYGEPVLGERGELGWVGTKSMVLCHLLEHGVMNVIFLDKKLHSELAAMRKRGDYNESSDDEM